MEVLAEENLPVAQGLDDYRGLTGPEKAAIFMVAVGEAHSARLFQMMDDNEIRELLQTMSSLDSISAPTVERLFAEFSERSSGTYSDFGSFIPTRRL